MKILLEMGTWECMQRHPSRTWISISFMTFGSFTTYKLQDEALPKAPRAWRSGSGAKARASAGQCGQDWGGVCNPSLTQAGNKLHRVCLKPGVSPPKKKYRCICAMCSWSPKLWLLWAVSAQSQFPGDNTYHRPVCQLFGNLHIQSIVPVVSATWERHYVLTSTLTVFNERGKRCSGDNITSNY